MSEKRPTRIPVVFYRTPSGSEVVLDWFRQLEDRDRMAVGQDLMRVQYRWPIGMPLCRSLGRGLWEVRVDFSNGRIARLLFSFRQGKLIVLHAFVKKTRKTPKADLELALKRDREFVDDGETDDGTAQR